MRHDVQLHHKNVELLSQLQRQLETLAQAIGELVAINNHALGKARLDEASSQTATAVSDKPEMLTKQILRLLFVAGDDGLNAIDLLELILKNRRVHASTIHTALRRFKTKGLVKLHNRRWYLVKTGQ